MKKKEIKVLMVAPGENPREVVLKNDMDSLQKAVSVGCDHQGLIEVISLEKGACMKIPRRPRKLEDDEGYEICWNSDNLTRTSVGLSQDKLLEMVEKIYREVLCWFESHTERNP